LDYEFKTTFVPNFLTKEDILEIGIWLKGSKKFYLQQFKSDAPMISSDLENISPNSKEELIKFVLSGRVVDEYGKEIDPQEFLDMAFAWGEPDGMVADEEYFNTTNHLRWMSNPAAYYDKIIDGLRVSSSTEFS